MYCRLIIRTPNIRTVNPSGVREKTRRESPSEGETSPEVKRMNSRPSAADTMAVRLLTAA